MRIRTTYLNVVWLISCLFTVQVQPQSLTVPQVETARKRSENHIQFENLQFVGSSQRHAGFSLALGTDESEPRHVIEGVTQSGQFLLVPFSEIVSIRSFGSDGHKIQLEVVRFPDISSKDLVALNPNCEQLAMYRRVVRIFIEQRSGQILYWLGSMEDYADINKIGRVADMQEGVTMQLRLPVNQTWWAIPAVAQDPLCSSFLKPLGGSAIQPPKR